MEEELLAKARTLKEESEEVEKSIEYINEQIREFEIFDEALKLLEENQSKEILAPLGKGVFVKAERKTNEKLFVEIGAGVLVRKTPQEAREIVKEQLIKFKMAKNELTGQLHEFALQFKKMLEEVERIKKKKKEEFLKE